MAKQTINIGSAANDGTGDPLRTAFDKANDNFGELYAVTGAGTGQNIAISGQSIISENTNGNIELNPNGTGKVVIATAAFLRFTDKTAQAVAFVDSDGDITFDTKLTYNPSTNTAVIEDINIKAATISTANSNQDITINPSGTGTIVHNGNTTINGTLDTTGLASLDGGIDVDGAFTVANTTGAITTTGLASLDGGIDVDGAFTVANTTGAITNSGTTTLSGNLDVTGSATISVASSLTVGSQLRIASNRIFTLLTNDNIDLDPAGTGTVNFEVPTQATVGSAGSATALPAQPTGYIKIAISGTPYIIPYYAVS